MADQARTIRIPVHMVEAVSKQAGRGGRCCRTWAGSPPRGSLAAELGMTPEKVIEVRKYGREPISLHTPVGKDGNGEFGDLIEDSDAIQ